MENLNEKIELVGREIEGQLSVMEKVVAGSETQEIASKSLERTVNAYAKLVETQEKIRRDDEELEMQNKKLKQEADSSKANLIVKCVDTGVVIVKAVAGAFMLYVLANVEAIDFSNGEIASKPVQNQRKAAVDVFKSWFMK